MGDFANVFRMLRQKAELTQEELSKILGISKSAVSMYENGNREPDFKTLERIADHFDVDTDYLLGRSLPADHPGRTGQTYEPSYDDIQSLIARNGKKLTLAQKQDLIKTLLSD